MINPTTYFRQTVSELKQVSWPSRAATTQLTIIVVAISILVGAYVGGLDYLFTSILKLTIK